MAKKQSTIDSINRYSQKQLPRETKPRRANTKPEKLVEKACMAWMREQGWSMQVFEAKATYNPRAGRYMQQSMKAGTADSGGSTSEGHGAVVEFKAHGKLSTYAKEDNHAQQKFIEEKIASNCFACVVDSVEMLQDIYAKWSMIRKENTGKARDYLLLRLPKRRKSNENDPIF